jgi:nitrous oxidase accessory protein NosD
VSTRDERGQESLCLYGDTLPPNLVRGRQYFVVESEPDFIRIATTPGGEVIRFAGDGGGEVRLLYPLFRAHLALYAPQGSGPGKGAIDLVSCQNVIVQGCRLSALGDAMHIQKSRDIVFSGNQITGARMGGFFLAEFCRNAVITGNTVDGTNGSRVMSVEKSCENVTVVGNTFRNGGRGSWINQPRNFVLADNIFINNTTKCEPDPRRGRRSFVTGGYEEYAELYFTTYEPNGRYGNVTVRGNVFVTGEEAAHAITFAAGGDTLQVTDNIFQGNVRTIVTAAGCTNVTIRDNVDGEVAVESR